MEGPSLVIAREELKTFLKKPIKRAHGTAKFEWENFSGDSLTQIRTWGKHLLLSFKKNSHLRVHFLMFGSYRVDNPRENRIPKMQFDYGSKKIYFYSCAIKALSEKELKLYDHSVDLMSKKWNAALVIKNLKKHPQNMVCDLLLDQNIFAGLGNIMKNEILFRLKLHPETKLKDLSPLRVRGLVKECERYAWHFYELKKANILKRNWKVMRKKICPECQGALKKRLTGKLQRWSFYCPRCQPKL